mmetsp:Transcript_1502/g.2344  ORF Transcript_1502/g.2344 Transcript_1502/m.2344 type:complete len:115 (+) Transcript_1502:20-364(+)
MARETAAGCRMGDGEDAPVGLMQKVLSELRVSQLEFIFLCVFWIGLCILSTFIDPSIITESPPVLFLLKLTEFLPIVTYICIFVGSIYAVYKFRASLLGGLSAVLSKLTRSKRR